MKKTLVITSILVLSIVTAGVAYAHWQKIITVDGTVQSGKLDIHWLFSTSNDDGINDDGLDPGLIVTRLATDGAHVDEYAAAGAYTRYNKDVASTDVEPLQYDDNNGCVSTAMIFDNVYPSYAPITSLWFINMGTIPAHIEDIELTVDGQILTQSGITLDNTYGLELIGWWVTYYDYDQKVDEVIYGVTKGEYIDLPYHPVMEPPAGIWCMPKLLAYLMGSDDYGDPSWGYPGIQIHPNDIYDVHLLWHFQEHTPQDPEDTPDPEYTFHIDITFINWNED